MSDVPATPSDRLLLSMTCYQCSGSQYISSTLPFRQAGSNYKLQYTGTGGTSLFFFRQWERRGGGLGWIEEETIIIKYIHLKTFPVLLSFVEKKNPVPWLSSEKLFVVMLIFIHKL